MPMNPRLLRPTASGFNPRQIAGLQLWLDASDSSTITTSTGVSEWRDKSATKSVWAQATGSDQPATGTATINGKNVLVFDGFSDSLSATTPLSTSMPLTMFVVQRIVSRRTFGMTYTAGTTGGHFDIRQETGFGSLQVVANSATVTAASATTDRAGFDDVLSLVFPSTGLNSIFLNGTALPLGAGNFTKPILTGTHYIGRRSDGFYANLQVAEIIAYSTLLTTAERQKVEGWLAWRWGLQGQLPTNHPYAYSFPGFGSQPQPSNAETLDWINRVYANGGTVSTSTANAVDAFCNAIDAAGIRDRFYRLNLFAGTGLNAALVPLYRGQSRTGTQFGNTTDTNNGPFVSGDYADTGASGGLKGNGTSKYLATGFATNQFASASDVHLSLSATGAETTGDIIPLGSFNGNVINLYTIDFAQAGTSRRGTRLGSGTVVGEVSPSATSESHLLGVRRSGTDLETYRAGASLATSTLSVSPAGSTREFFVFGLNSSGTAQAFTAARMRMYSIGIGMTDAQASDFFDAVDAFNTAMGRT